MNPLDNRLFTDVAHLAKLKNDVRAEGDDVSDTNLREVARQFESLFTHMIMKNMRAASLGEGAMDSNQTRFYQDMFDQQLSTQLSRGSGLGLADLLVQQLGGSPPGGSEPPQRHAVLGGIRPGTVEPRASVRPTDDTAIKGPVDFVRKALPHARRVAKLLGVGPQLVLAQAALETGWGQKVIRNEDGTSSNNLFGIKASAGWDGKTAVVTTREFTEGVEQTVKAPFRSYRSMLEGFNDYARLLLNSDRYRNVIGAGDDSAVFAQGLQQSGYATDPEYANKIINIVNSETLKNAMHVTRQSQQR